MAEASSRTIAAVATPPGFGGVGVVRVSGPAAFAVARGVLGRLPPARRAFFSDFLAGDGSSIDQGIALCFPAPRSFTGEDVLELQGHGGPVVMDLLLRRTLELGARLARPGEFTERAFLNGKIDLAQAEAIADLIASTTEQAARLAARTLEGAFSQRVRALVERLTRLRVLLEAALDFPDEDLDPLQSCEVSADLQRLATEAGAILADAEQGCLIREGIQLVIAGPPNAGKSSLLNALSGDELAIVTDVPGTTRDLLRHVIHVDGMPLHIVDTAGLHHATDPVEREGIRRARGQIERADRVLWVFDGAADPRHEGFDSSFLPPGVPVTFVRNKIDLAGVPPGLRRGEAGVEVAISATTGAGLDALREHLKDAAGLQGPGEGRFLARRRHLDALKRALTFLERSVDLNEMRGGAELVAEELRLAQAALGEITGEVTSDELLGRIFSELCIGK